MLAQYSCGSLCLFVSVIAVIISFVAERKGRTVPRKRWMAQNSTSSQVYACSIRVVNNTLNVSPHSPPSHSPTVTSTLRGLSTAYREQGREETAKELEKLTKEEVSRSQSC